MPKRIFIDQQQRLADLALRNRLATIYGQQEYVDAGGLLSNGSRLQDLFRRAAAHVEKILTGAKAPDLAVEPQLTSVFLHLTNRCNPRGRHCYVNSGPEGAIGLSDDRLFVLVDEI